VYKSGLVLYNLFMGNLQKQITQAQGKRSKLASIVLTDDEADALVGGWRPEVHPYATLPQLARMVPSLRRSPTFWLRVFADYPRLLTEEEVAGLPMAAKVARSTLLFAQAGIDKARQTVFDRLDGVPDSNTEVRKLIQERAKQFALEYGLEEADVIAMAERISRSELCQ
jgi:hypothetical protein